MSFRLWKEAEGVLAEEKMWCISENGYLYLATTLLKVFYMYVHENEEDKHMVG